MDCVLVYCSVLVAQSCLTLCDPKDCNPPGSSTQGTFQARRLEWVYVFSWLYPTEYRVSVSYSRASSWPNDPTCVSCISCIPYHCSTIYTYVLIFPNFIFKISYNLMHFCVLFFISFLINKLIFYLEIFLCGKLFTVSWRDFLKIFIYLFGCVGC